jgi:hypothetical protein
VKMLMEIDPLSMRGSLVMEMASISPSRREVSPAEQLRRSPRFLLEGSFPGRISPPESKSAPAQVRPRDGGAPSQKSSLYFFYGKWAYIPENGHWRLTRGPTTHQGALGDRRALVPSGHLGGPLWYFFAPFFIIYSYINLHKI